MLYVPGAKAIFLVENVVDVERIEPSLTVKFIPFGKLNVPAWPSSLSPLPPDREKYPVKVVVL